MQPDSEKDPAVVLPYLLGRKIQMEEIYEAFGLKRSTYYDLLTKGTLTTADRLVGAARHFNINPVDLLVLYGLLDKEEVVASAMGVAHAVNEAVELGKCLPTNGRGILARLLNIELARQPGVNPL